MTDDRLRFSLRLSNGHEWQLMASDLSEVWLNEFAALLRLSRTYIDANGSPGLIFTDRTLWPWKAARPGLEHHHLDAELPADGWTCRNLGALTIWTHPGSSDVICELKAVNTREIHIIQMWMALDPVYSRALDSGGLPLHAGLLERDGHAVLLAGPGCMGKSTCCKRVLLPWRSHCDDETLVVKTRDGRFRGHPFPTWSDYLGKECDKTWDVQQSFPIKGIFFLRQGRTDSVAPIGPAQAAMFLYQSALEVMGKNSRDIIADQARLLKTKMLESACGLAREVPAFILHVSLEGKFWEEIERCI